VLYYQQPHAKNKKQWEISPFWQGMPVFIRHNNNRGNQIFLAADMSYKFNVVYAFSSESLTEITIFLR
jgi:hypothetical protein